MYANDICLKQDEKLTLANQNRPPLTPIMPLDQALSLRAPALVAMFVLRIFLCVTPDPDLSRILNVSVAMAKVIFQTHFPHLPPLIFVKTKRKISLRPQSESAY